MAERGERRCPTCGGVQVISGGTETSWVHKDTGQWGCPPTEDKPQHLVLLEALQAEGRLTIISVS